MPHSPCSPDLIQSEFFCFPRFKNVLKGKSFANMEDIKAKNGRSTKRHQNRQVQKLLSAVGKKVSIGLVHQVESTLEVIEV